jgi:hypothetical protein
MEISFGIKEDNLSNRKSQKFQEDERPRIWGAQAASLSFSAACRKAHRTFVAQNSYAALGVVGKLPTTTG